MKRAWVSIIGALVIAAAAFFPAMLVLLAPVLARGIVLPCIVPVSIHIVQMHWVEARGEMGWSGDIGESVARLAQCRSDRASFARQLLADSSGTVVSLGMDLVVQEAFEDGDVLLARFKDDRRWNHNLALNDEYAAFMTVLWKMKRGMPLTSAEQETTEGWSAGYFEKVGLAPPAK